MRYWNGLGVYQWEHTRRWELTAGTSEFTRAEGALLVPGGLSSLSFFVRRQSQSASTFELSIWTTPVFFKPLDEVIDSTTASQYLLELTLEPASSLSLTGTAMKVFGGKIKSDQPMGSLLFWEMANTGGSNANMIGDIYVVPNHIGVASGTRLSSAADGMDGSLSQSALQSGTIPSLRSR